jgi:hypothetical protein
MKLAYKFLWSFLKYTLTVIYCAGFLFFAVVKFIELSIWKIDYQGYHSMVTTTLPAWMWAFGLCVAQVGAWISLDWYLTQKEETKKMLEKQAQRTEEIEVKKKSEAINRDWR